MRWKAAGPDCTQPLQLASFTLLSTEGRGEGLLLLRILRELGEGGGKLPLCTEWSDTPVCQTSFWQCRTFSEASVLEELPYLWVYQNNTCLRERLDEAVRHFQRTALFSSWNMTGRGENASVLQSLPAPPALDYQKVQQFPPCKPIQKHCRLLLHSLSPNVKNAERTFALHLHLCPCSLLVSCNWEL